MFRKRMGSQQGFTLIELVVVVAILGILAVIVTPKVMGAIDNARTNGYKTSAKQVQVAMERYYAEQGKYPDPAVVCATGTAYNATTFAGCTVTELKTALGNYVNLDTANITDTVATYKVVAGASGSAATYQIVLNFKDGSTDGKDYTITADSITP